MLKMLRRRTYTYSGDNNDNRDYNIIFRNAVPPCYLFKSRDACFLYTHPLISFADGFSAAFSPALLGIRTAYAGLSALFSLIQIKQNSTHNAQYN